MKTLFPFTELHLSFFRDAVQDQEYGLVGLFAFGFPFVIVADILVFPFLLMGLLVVHIDKRLKQKRTNHAALP